MRLQPEEPPVRAWELLDREQAVDHLVPRSPTADGRPALIAVDGRSASGKTTLAGLLRTSIPSCVVVHTDDVAWNESPFGWDRLLAEHVLLPLRRGESLRYRPAAWVRHGRAGSIDVPGDAAVVVIEGVGSSRRAFRPLLDRAVWVQSDLDAAEERGLARDIESGVNGGPEESRAFWDAWMRTELAFLARDRPWERADIVAAGTTVPGSEPGRIALAPGPL